VLGYLTARLEERQGQVSRRLALGPSNARVRPALSCHVPRLGMRPCQELLATPQEDTGSVPVERSLAGHACPALRRFPEGSPGGG
jgi:hypothetical protein